MVKTISHALSTALAVFVAALGAVFAAETPTTNEARSKAADVLKLAIADGGAEKMLEAARAVVGMVPGNLLVAELLSPESLGSLKLDDAGGVKELRQKLIEAERILRFEPVKEAPYPKDFPPTTPLGEIEVKALPSHRLARAGNAEKQDRSFWTLFQHIKKNKIEMTAPVEMEFAPDAKDFRDEASMAFLYQNTELGKLGEDGDVQVVDAEPLTVVSIGIRGSANREQVAWAREKLVDWLAKHPEYRASGNLRVLGYNSPFINKSRSFCEVQFRVERVEGAQDEI